jgi:hypothetical protein
MTTPTTAEPVEPMTTNDPAAADASVGGRHRALVIGSRTVLLMLLIAALVVLGLGVFFYLRGGDDPTVEGWLRTIFGKVFLGVAIGLAAFLGIPSLVGLWAMSGANKEGAAPALDRPVRMAFAGIAIAAVIVTAVVLLMTGSAITIPNIGLLAIVALATLGLGGAVSFSTHRGRAILAAIALVAFVVATAWILVNAFISPPLP